MTDTIENAPTLSREEQNRLAARTRKAEERIRLLWIERTKPLDKALSPTDWSVHDGRGATEWWISLNGQDVNQEGNVRLRDQHSFYRGRWHGSSGLVEAEDVIEAMKHRAEQLGATVEPVIHYRFTGSVIMREAVLS